MNRKEILEGLAKYFKIQELVDEATYNMYGNDAWSFFDTDLLHTLLAIREGIGEQITINTWSFGGNLDERGLRTNLCDIVKDKTDANKLYLSGHVLGKALDYDVRNFTAERARVWISEHRDILPCKLRIEHNTPWIHMDIKYYTDRPNLYFFNA